jgi:hypothetical protein
LYISVVTMTSEEIAGASGGGIGGIGGEGG